MGKSNRFAIQDSAGRALGYKDVVIQDTQGLKFLHYPESLDILYGPDRSRINFQEAYVYFEKDGFFAPDAIGWEGEMGRKRLGDLLPYEYNPEE